MADTIPTVYISHPYNAPTEDERDANCDNAELWALWMVQRYECAPKSDWTNECREGETPEESEDSLRKDREQCMRCRVAVLCGSYLSPQMRTQARGHPCTIDLTQFGLVLPPTDAMVLGQFDELFRCAGVRRR